jgi:hypothetical protein
MWFEDWYGRAELVAGGEDAGLLDGLGEAAAHGAQGERGDFGFGLDGEIGGFAGKFAAAVEGQSGFAEEFGGKAHVFGAIDAPEPQFFLIALEKIQGFFELGHRAAEGRSQEKDVERPGMAGIAHLNADAILSALISLHAAAVGVAYRSGASGNFGFHGASEPDESAKIALQNAAAPGNAAGCGVASKAVIGNVTRVSRRERKGKGAERAP